MHIYIAKSGQQTGPFSEDQIQSMLDSGMISLTDAAWHDGLASWLPLNQVVTIMQPITAAGQPPPIAQVLSAAPLATSSELASFGIRLGAHILDAIVTYVLSFIVGFVIGYRLGGTTAPEFIQVFAVIAGILSSWLYYSLMECSANQATLGKMACGLFVTDIRGQRIGFGQASGRYFSKIFSVISLGIGFLMCAWTDKKQCLHDMMAGCLVLRKVGQKDTQFANSPSKLSLNPNAPQSCEPHHPNKNPPLTALLTGLLAVGAAVGVSIFFVLLLSGGLKKQQSQGPPAASVSPPDGETAQQRDEVESLRKQTGTSERIKHDDRLLAPQPTRYAPALRSVPLITELPPEFIEGTPKPMNVPNLLPAPTKAPEFLVPTGTTLLSKGRKVTSSTPNPIICDLTLITDGEKQAGEGYFVEILDNTQWVQIDLEKSAAIFAIWLWHFHSQKRAYNDVIVQISDDPEFKTGVTTVYNNDYDDSSKLGKGNDNPYIETRFGLIVEGKGTKGRYVRLYSMGNTSNEMNHYIEVEVFGKVSADGKPEADHVLKKNNTTAELLLADAVAMIPKLLDLGSTKSLPCKAMVPILEELKKEYTGRMNVEFIDVWENENAGKEYGVEMIPTQIFYGADGKELFRHTGFFGKEDILAKWKELGVDLR